MRPRFPAGTTALLAGAGLSLLAGAALRRSQRLDLRGQVVVITGGSRGLGLLLAREFATAGCQVAICARDEADLDRARQELERHGAQVLAVPADIADRSQAERLIEQVTARFGRVDVLVNNAGVHGPVGRRTVSPRRHTALRLPPARRVSNSSTTRSEHTQHAPAHQTRRSRTRFRTGWNASMATCQPAPRTGRSWELPALAGMESSLGLSVQASEG